MNVTTKGWSDVVPIVVTIASVAIAALGLLIGMGWI